MAEQELDLKKLQGLFQRMRSSQPGTDFGARNRAKFAGDGDGYDLSGDIAANFRQLLAGSGQTSNIAGLLAVLGANRGLINDPRLESTMEKFKYPLERQIETDLASQQEDLRSKRIANSAASKSLARAGSSNNRSAWADYSSKERERADAAKKRLRDERMAELEEALLRGQLLRQQEQEAGYSNAEDRAQGGYELMRHIASRMLSRLGR